MRQENAAQKQYEIKICGQLDDCWHAWFDGFAFVATADGNTLLQGSVCDQAALYGVLRKVNNLGLTLMAVNVRSS